MRTCAWLPPPYTIFSFPYFFPAGDFRCSVGFLLFGSYFRVVSAECVLCVVRCFFWVFVCCFFDSGFVWEFVWRFGFVLRDFLMLVKMMGCQCESVQIEGVSSVMSGIFGVIQ